MQRLSVIGRLLTILVACVCKTFRDQEMPLCSCGVFHHGDSAPMDCGECACDAGSDGRLYARVVQIQPTDLDTSRTTANTGPCRNPLLTVELEVSVYRCVALTADGTSPDVMVQALEAQQYLADEQLMRRAVSCCTTPEGLGAWTVRPGIWTPVTGGTCAGGSLRATASGLVKLADLTSVPDMSKQEVFR